MIKDSCEYIISTVGEVNKNYMVRNRFENFSENSEKKQEHVFHNLSKAYEIAEKIRHRKGRYVEVKSK